MMFALSSTAEDVRSKITERFLGFFGNLKNDLTRSRIRSIQNPTSSTLSFQIKLLVSPLGGRMRRVHFSPHAACQFPYNCSSQKNVAGSAGPPEYDYRQAEACYRMAQKVVLSMVCTPGERTKNEERLKREASFSVGKTGDRLL